MRAPADGYTLLLVGSPNAINATLYENLNFNFIRDVAPVASLIRGALVMLVHPSVPAKTLPEFIAYAKANPGKLSYGSGGIGGITHLTPELFKQEAGGLDILHVPYRGVAPALTDLLGGRVQVVFANPAPSIGYIGAGKLRRSSRSPQRRVRKRCRTSRQLASSSPATKQAQSLASVCPKTLLPKSSTALTKRSTPRSSIPRSRLNLQNWMLRCLAVRRPISESCSLRKPKSGPR